MPHAHAPVTHTHGHVSRRLACGPDPPARPACMQVQERWRRVPRSHASHQPHELQRAAPWTTRW
eukprot:2619343-Prymnesium_polylepis.1